MGRRACLGEIIGLWLAFPAPTLAIPGQTEVPRPLHPSFCPSLALERLTMVVTVLCSHVGR